MKSTFRCKIQWRFYSKNELLYLAIAANYSTLYWDFGVVKKRDDVKTDYIWNITYWKNGYRLCPPVTYLRYFFHRWIKRRKKRFSFRVRRIEAFIVSNSTLLYIYRTSHNNIDYINNILTKIISKRDFLFLLSSIFFLYKMKLTRVEKWYS